MPLIQSAPEKDTDSTGGANRPLVTVGSRAPSEPGPDRGIYLDIEPGGDCLYN